MNSANQLLLYLNSNIERYEISIYDGYGVCTQRITARQACVCVCPSSPCLRIVASPLTSGYSTKLYFWIDTTCQSIVSLYFNFPRNTAPAPVPVVNTFTLTDSTYGLPIDGSLLFTQA